MRLEHKKVSFNSIMQKGTYGAPTNPDTLGVRINLPSHLMLCSRFDPKFDAQESAYYAFSWAASNANSQATLTNDNISLADGVVIVFMPTWEFDSRKNQDNTIAESDPLLTKYDQELMRNTLRIRRQIKAALR